MGVSQEAEAMTTPQISIFITLMIAVMGTCERLVTHYDIDCRTSRVWQGHEVVPEHLLDE